MTCIQQQRNRCIHKATRHGQEHWTIELESMSKDYKTNIQTNTYICTQCGKEITQEIMEGIK